MALICCNVVGYPITQLLLHQIDRKTAWFIANVFVVSPLRIFQTFISKEIAKEKLCESLVTPQSYCVEDEALTAKYRTYYWLASEHVCRWEDKNSVILARVVYQSLSVMRVKVTMLEEWYGFSDTKWPEKCLKYNNRSTVPMWDRSVVVHESIFLWPNRFVLWSRHVNRVATSRPRIWNSNSSPC